MQNLSPILDLKLKRGLKLDLELKFHTGYNNQQLVQLGDGIIQEGEHNFILRPFLGHTRALDSFQGQL